ncbi:MAG TPA: hypothetical protein VGE30_04025 [Candidatus Saccharimonadales bacterium]
MSEQIITSPEAARADIDQTLEVLEQRNDRLAAEVHEYQNTNTWPQWWYDTGGIAGETLRNLDTYGDPQDILRYYEAEFQRRLLGAQISTHEQDLTTVSSLVNNVYPISPSKLGLAMREEEATGNLHTEILTAISVEKRFVTCNDEMLTLASYYGFERPTDLLRLQAGRGNDYDDAVHAAVRKPHALKTLYFLDAQKPKDQDDWQNNNTYQTRWVTEALSAATGMDHEEAGRYALGLPRRPNPFKNENEHTVMADMLQRFEQLGVDRIRTLSETTGIHALDAYSLEQLTRMEQLISQPEQFAQTLASQDVTVLMVNRSGDYSGVMRDAAEDFEDDTDAGTTLFFEVDTMTDIYRTITKLKHWGIQPSTIAVGAHSAKGQFIVSKERVGEQRTADVASIAGKMVVAKANGDGSLGEGNHAFAIEEARALSRIVNDYMKPSKLDGKKKIVFEACYAGADAPVRVVDEKGEIVESSEQASVISKIAELLAAKGVASDVELYGAETAIQLHRTDRGVGYTTKPEDGIWEGGRSHQDVKKVSVHKNKLTSEEVSEIVLRG